HRRHGRLERRAVRAGAAGSGRGIGIEHARGEMKTIGIAVLAAAMAALIAGDEARPAGSVWESKKSAWEQLTAGQKEQVFRFADDYKAYLKVSRSALTSTREVIRLGKAAGFAEFTDPAQVKPGSRLFVVAHDRAVILIAVGSDPIVAG